MNGFPITSLVFKTYLFADDTIFLYSLLICQYLDLTEELKKSPDWMQIHGLTLNLAKEQVLQVAASQEHKLFLGQYSIEKQSGVSYFGVKIVEKLAFIDHFHEFDKKTSKLR